MEKHSDLDTAIGNLTDLMSMIEHRSDDKYICAMKQYLVNPLAWVLTEKVVRAAKTTQPEQATNKQSAGPKQTQICRCSEGSLFMFSFKLASKGMKYCPYCSGKLRT